MLPWRRASGGRNTRSPALPQAQTRISGSSLKKAFLEIIWPRRRLALLGLTLILVSRLARLVLPLSVRYLFDDVIGQGNLEPLYWLVAAVGGAVALQATTSYALTVLMGVESHRLVADMRVRTQSHVLALPVPSFDSRKSGELVSRIMHDVAGVQHFVGTGLVHLVGGVVTALVGLGFLLMVSPVMTVLAVAPLAGFALVSKRAFESVRPFYRAYGKIHAAVVGRLTEAIGGIRVVKGFDAAHREEEVFGAGVAKLFANHTTTTKMASRLSSLGSFFVGLVGVVVMGYGAGLVVGGDLTAGEFVSFTALLGFLATPVQQIATVGTRMSEALASLDRTAELLSWRREDDDERRTVEMPGVIGQLEFEDVHFSYTPDKPVLKGISFEARPGTVVALVGSSGSGKSTIAGLAASFLDPDQGRVLVDGVDIRGVKLATYRRQLGLVLQDEFLFEGTIRENVHFACPGASDDEVERAAERAYVTAFAQRFPDGLETVIGERGVKLSGGQRQRVAIARAMLTDPRILVLDEATSSLDAESETLIQQSLTQLKEGRTTLVIAHRLSTIRRADLILVIEGGRIVERGKHDELIEQPGRYRQLYTAQMRI